MKNKKMQLVIGIVFVFVLTLVFIFLKKPKLDTDIKRASYALGQQIGMNFKSQQIQYDPDILAYSLRDVLKENPSLMSVEEIQTALTVMQKNLLNRKQHLANKGEMEAAAFLEKNKKDDDVKITASGLQYIILKEGKGPNLKSDDVVKAHYVGMLSTGKKFDSTYDRNVPAEFRVGTLIRGWSEGMKLTKKGGKIKLFIPPGLGYGGSDRPGIPAYSVLVIEVEVL